MNDKILTIKKSTLVDIANEVRAKTGSTELIKVADLDDAVANLQGGGGGGIIEVEELMKGLPSDDLTYDVNEEMIVSVNKVPCEKVYLNTSLSVDEVVTLIKKVTQDIDAVVGEEMAAYGYSIIFGDENGTDIGSIQLYNYFAENSDGSYSYSDVWVIDRVYFDEDSNEQWETIFSSDTGWASGFNGVIEVNAASTICYVRWNYDVNWSEDPYFNPGIINKNDVLMKLVSSTGSFETPNEESVYKLPDETLWIYDNGWFELVKQTNESVGEYYTDDMMGWFGTDSYTEFKKPTTVVINQDQVDDYDIKLTMSDGKVYKYKKVEELYSEPRGFEPVYSNMGYKINFHFKHEDAPVVTLPFVHRYDDAGGLVNVSQYFNDTDYNNGVIFNAESFFEYNIEDGSNEEVLPSVFPSKLGMFWVGSKNEDRGYDGVADFQNYFTNDNITLEGTLENDSAYVVCNLNEALGLTNAAIDHLEITAPGHETLLKMYRYTTPS